MSQAERVTDLVRRAKAASERVGELRTDVKDIALRRAADALEAQCERILAENAKDLDAARERGIEAYMLDRLALTPERVSLMATGFREVAALPDPVGEVTGMWNRPSGLQVGRMRIPLGVILVIYEARPNVTADVSALCLKSGNATILRGGSEAIHSNRELARVLRQSFGGSGVPEDAVQLVGDTSRELVDQLLQCEGEIDLVIPRGGESLIRRVVEQSRIPVIKHYRGLCHVYLDEFAEPKMAREIALNSKVQRPSVCNSAETLLIHAALAQRVLPDVLGTLAAHGVELRADARTRELFPQAVLAKDDDYHTEWLAKTMSVRMVDSIDQAIEHIRAYGTNHTETIVTQDVTRAREFVRRVNSSSVFVNASTRFSDGYQLGLGAEVGVSTTKMHWYGPMGLEGLTTQKFFAYGEGTILE
jgi:glutamate-5-semialdehyde dehydrogenase